MDQEFKVVKLHDFPDLIEQAALLLNSEWPRSLTARCHSLKDSSDDLPCSMLLLQVSNDSVPKVVGYSHLFKVLHNPKSVLIESVIIDTALRGCGLGRMIMEKTEDMARELGYGTSHLSTHNKCMFYEHLGYKNSTAVSPERKVAKFLSKALIEKYDEDYHEGGTKTLVPDDVLEQDVEKRVAEKEVNHLQLNVTRIPLPLLPAPLPLLPAPPPLLPAPPLPPTPPPLPQVDTTEKNKNSIGEHKRIIWMKKHL